MRCKTEIYVGLVEDAVYVPLQAVFREGPAAFVYVPQGTGFAQRRVELGESSGLHVQITRGVTEGEPVLLREPQTREIVARLDDEPSEGQAALGRPGRGWARNGRRRPTGGSG